MRFFINLPKGLLIGPLIGLLAACSSMPADQISDARDPYENTNRSVFEFNMAVDTAVVEPAAKGYRALPQFMQDGFEQSCRMDVISFNCCQFCLARQV